MKRVYMVEPTHDEYVLVIVAESHTGAKKIAFHHCREEIGDNTEWIDLRIKVKKEIDASKFEIGPLDELEALKLGLYGCVETMDCPKCKREEIVYSNDGDPACSGCMDGEE